jgi:DNA-binding transcriptional LysR family regulator
VRGPAQAACNFDKLGSPVEICQLKAVLALRDLASLTKAAKLLHLSPSAVFCQIRQLEEEFGLKLYEHAGKRLHLTDFGRLLAKQAQEIMQTHDAALDLLRQSTASPKPVLRIGCGPHGSVRIMPYLLRAFLAAQPNTEIRLTTSDETMFEDLRLGALDAIVAVVPVDDAELRGEPLWSFEQVVVLPVEGTGPGTAVTAADLRQYPFILYRRTAVAESIFVDLCRKLGFEPNIVMENDEVDSIKELVKMGIGATFLPYWSVGDEVSKGTLRVLRVPLPRSTYGLVYRHGGFQPQTIDVLREVAHRWQEWWPMAPYVEPSLL